jgi:hypothetical protein
MNMLKLTSLAVAAIAALSLSAAYAVDEGGVNIKGNTNVIGVAKDVATVAIGKDNKAGTSVGAIHGGTTIKGNTNVIGVAKDVATVAIGKGNVACTEIGAIGDNPACKK